MAYCGFLLFVLVAFGRNANALNNEALQGVWEMTELVSSGEAFPVGQSPEKTRFVFADNKLVRAKDEFIEDIQAFRINSTANPKQIELTSSNGPVFSGIFKLENDKLTLCFGRNRPRTFESNATSQTMLIVLTRVSGLERK